MYLFFLVFYNKEYHLKAKVIKFTIKKKYFSILFCLAKSSLPLHNRRQSLLHSRSCKRVQGVDWVKLSWTE